MSESNIPIPLDWADKDRHFLSKATSIEHAVSFGFHVENSGEKNYFLGSGEIKCSRHIQLLVKGRSNFLGFAGGGKINFSRIQILGNGNTILIGENFDIDSTRIQIQGNNCKIAIGNNFRVNAGTYILAKEDDRNVRIGDDCLFSTNIVIRTSDNHGIFDLATRTRINSAKDVTISSRVWIGEDAKILKGVHIDSDSIIGASSVVTKNVPSNVAVAGNPARIVREGIFWYKHFTLPAEQSKS
ncbi:acyltransferase [Roseomonas mucosa]